MSGSTLILLARHARELEDLLPCQRESADLWFSDVPADLEAAKTHCRGCPIRESCLTGAVERAEPYGVWGGEIFEQGAIIPRKRPRGRPPGRHRLTLHPVTSGAPTT